MAIVFHDHRWKNDTGQLHNAFSGKLSCITAPSPLLALEVPFKKYTVTTRDFLLSTIHGSSMTLRHNISSAALDWRKVYSVFSTVFLLLLLLVVAVGCPAACFGMMKSFCLLKYSKAKSIQDSPSQ